MSYQRFPRVFLPLVAFLACTLTNVLAGDLPEISGAPPGWESSVGSISTVPPGLDDTLRPLLARSGTVAATLDASDTSEPGNGELATSALWEQLAALPPEVRGQAVIELEPGPGVGPIDLHAAREASALWNHGRHQQAIEKLRGLEEAAVPLGLGIAWKDRAPAGVRTLGDVRIGGTRTDGLTVSVDFDAQTGHLFSVVQWGTTATSAWTANISADRGATWEETYVWTSTVGIIDVDAAVVDDYLYVGYVAGNTMSELRTRRCRVSDGTVDGGYGFQIALAAAPNTFSDIAVVTNAADYDNRVYCLGIESSHTLRFAWDIASDGTTFFEETPPAVANASAGLAVTWDHHRLCDEILHVSYAGTDDNVHVQSRTLTAWTDATLSAVAYSQRTSISAYGETVICAFERPYNGGRGIRYHVSYDCGTAWSSFADLALPDSTNGSYMCPAVDARSGLGTAIVYQQEAGEPDAVFYQYRLGYGPGPWEEREAFNDYDVVTGSDTALNSLPDSSLMEHGAIYMGAGYCPYFDHLGPATTSSAPVAPQSTSSLQLLPACPNPFSDRTMLRFVLPEPGHALLQVFDVLGRKIATLVDGPLDAGVHAVPLEGERRGSMVYFYRLTSGTQQKEGRVIAIR